MIFQDPLLVAEPAAHGRRHHLGPVRHPGHRAARWRQAGRPGPDGAGRAQPRALQPLPQRVLRRSAAAHRHRPGGRAAAQADRLRRAGVGPRRLDPGPGHQPARGPAGRLRPGLPLHRPRPVRGPAHLRPGRWSCTSARSWSSPTATTSTTVASTPTARAALSGARSPDPDEEADPRADPARGRPAQPDQPAVGLRVPHPVLEGAGALPGRGAAAASSASRATRSPATSPRTRDLVGVVDVDIEALAQQAAALEAEGAPQRLPRLPLPDPTVAFRHRRAQDADRASRRKSSSSRRMFSVTTSCGVMWVTPDSGSTWCGRPASSSARDSRRVLRHDHVVVGQPVDDQQRALELARASGSRDDWRRTPPAARPAGRGSARCRPCRRAPVGRRRAGDGGVEDVRPLEHGERGEIAAEGPATDADAARGRGPRGTPWPRPRAPRPDPRAPGVARSRRIARSQDGLPGVP